MEDAAHTLLGIGVGWFARMVWDRQLISFVCALMPWRYSPHRHDGRRA